MKASTTICRLVLSFLSQFFQSRRHAKYPSSSQAKPLHHPSLWKHHEGVQFVAFHFHRGSQRLCTATAKGFPV